MMMLALAVELILLAATHFNCLASDPSFHEQPRQIFQNASAAGIHLPLHRRELPRACQRRDETGAAALGDFMDVSYSVQVQVGETALPLVIDTGSSDLWVITDDSGLTPSPGTSLYPHAEFQSSGLSVHLVYGDSNTTTHADGTIGEVAVSLAGLTLQNQFFAAINSTNTTVLETGSVGIFGIGFPLNSIVWATLLKNQSVAGTKFSRSKERREMMGDSANLSISHFDLLKQSFPDLAYLHFNAQKYHSYHHRRPSISDIVAYYAFLDPFLPRLLSNNSTPSSTFTITLQRDTTATGGNPGMLSIGELPPGVNNDSLTWTPVRRYPIARTQGSYNIPDPRSEMYPIAWEVFVDAVFFDGEKLPPSALSSANISLSALIDTGNSLIRGPADVVKIIRAKIGGSKFPCSAHHTLAFQIGGRMFPVDPRDFATQAYAHSAAECFPNVVATDPPRLESGFLYSWSLGDPFLKSVIASFYFGNLSHPYEDPPRVGLLSTVPSDAGALSEATVSTNPIHHGGL